MNQPSVSAADVVDFFTGLDFCEFEHASDREKRRRNKRSSFYERSERRITNEDDEGELEGLGEVFHGVS